MNLKRHTVATLSVAAGLLGSACGTGAVPASAGGSGGANAAGAPPGASGGQVSAATPAAGAGGALVGGTAGTTSSDSVVAGASGAGGQSGASGAAGQASLNELASALHGRRLELECHHPQENPCEPQNSAVPNRGYLCCYVDETIERKNVPPVDEELVFGGDPAIVYDVELRIRGVLENHDYGDQGAKQGEWVLLGGELPAPGAIHVFGITTRDPEQTYFFNSWNDKTDPARMVAIDYALTVPMRGGSLVRVFEYDDIGKIWANAEGLKIEGIAPYPAVFDGQFLQMDVISVERQP